MISPTTFLIVTGTAVLIALVCGMVLQALLDGRSRDTAYRLGYWAGREAERRERRLRFEQAEAAGEKAA